MTGREPTVVVIDQGSTLTKGAVVGPGGRRQAEISVPVEVRTAGPRIEHDAEALATGVRRAVDELSAQARVDAVGLACQRSSCLLWEREGGRPLTPVISWQDTREAQRVGDLAPHADEVARRTGLRLSPHYAAPKLAGLLDALPGARRRAAAGEIVAGTLDAFLVRGLSGIDATEPGHAGRSLLYNLENGDWDPALCDLFGIPPAALPEIRPSAGWRGPARGRPLTALAGDQQAALLGHGGWSEGVTAVHFGTGAFVLASTGAGVRRHPALLSAVLASTADGRRFQIEGPVNSAGSAVDWACRLGGLDLEKWRDRALEPESLPRVLPAFAGAAAPWWRPRAGGVVSGLRLEQGGEELLAGVLSGLAMRVLDSVEALAEAGTPTRVLRVSGKLTRLSGLVGLLADAGQMTVEVARDEETGLLGAARLAAAGLTGEEAPLLRRPAVGARREPRWPPEKARWAREAWLRFARAALELEG